MYAFVFGVNGRVIFGRDYDDLEKICKELKRFYGLSESKRLPVYVHNLKYEWQFIRLRFKWLDVFATEDRNPIRALCDYGIEFRDSYILSGMSLARTGKDLTKYKVEKLSGELDYTKLRHSKTRLTPQEWHYIENDGLVVMAFIQEEIERNNDNITNIPMTKTGYVRKYMRNQCYHGGQKGHGERRKIKTRDFSSYKRIMQRLTLSEEEYYLAKEAFAGGFTHANNFNVGLIFENVSSYDLTSAYPAAMVLERYPMGKGEPLRKFTKDEIEKKLKLYACIFRVRLTGVISKFRGDNFLSFSKCRNCKNYELDNGRIMTAESLETTLTNIDLEIIRAFYDFKKIEFLSFWYYPRGYLPRNFIKGVLGLYADKTTLKGVEGMEAEYLLKKGLLNATFGMSVTAIEQPMHKYDGKEWIEETPKVEEMLKKYNESPNRFLFYLWGIFVTAHVRKTIARAILELGDDYLYADTDSVKFLHHEKHKAFFETYNASILRKIALSSDFNKLDSNLYMPRTKDGLEKPIGVFDNEGDESGLCYKRFKTLGAKRYFVEYPSPHKLAGVETCYSLTISGVNKNLAIPALEEKAKKEGKDIFEYFDIDAEYNEQECGRNTHTYCDFEIQGEIVDYLGEKGKYHELAFTHLQNTTYKLTTTEEYRVQLYLDFLERRHRRERQKL